MSIKSKIRTVPNWPQKGIMFRDITTLLKDPEGLKQVTEDLYNRYKDSKIDVVAGIESRGFILGSILAYKLGVGFVMIRKPGKLPSDTIKESYDLEYGSDTLEIHKDAIQNGQRVLLVDDLLATGGTISAAIKLIERLGGEIVESCFIVGLPELGAKEKLPNQKLYWMVEFDGE